MISLDEAKAFSGIDIDNDDELIRSFIAAVDEYLLGALGNNCPEVVLHSERANLIRKLVVDDLYNNRRYTAEIKVEPRGVAASMLLQLKVEAMPE